MKIKFDNYGVFFMKVKENNEIYMASYIKTDYLIKNKQKSIPKTFLVPNLNFYSQTTNTNISETIQLPL